MGAITSRNSIGLHKFKKFQELSSVIHQKLYFINIRTTLNNTYVTVTDKFGRVLVLRSGGMLKLVNLKRNTVYAFELMLAEVLKYLVKFRVNSVIVRSDVVGLKKKKVILKLLHKFGIKVLCIQLQLFRAFNGIRPEKKRRI